MVLPTRSYTIDELGDPTAPIGSRPWSLWVANEIRKALDTDDHVEQTLRDLTTAFKEQQAWQELGCLSWEDFCAKYLHRPASRVDVALDATARTVAHAAQAKPNPDNGYHPTSDNCKTPEHGNSADYLTARIARDHPAILERMKAGEFRSVRAAAIEAGIVNPKERYNLPSDPQAAGRYLAQRVDREWIETMLGAYEGGEK